MDLHEDFRRTNAPPSGSDRAFGIVFVAVFTLVALWPLIKGEPVRTPLLIAAAVLLGITLLRPRLLRQGNRAWARLGAVLHGVVSPVVMAAILYLVVTPIGILLRVFGKDPLRLKIDRAAASYWIERDPPGPDPAGMSNPF